MKIIDLEKFKDACSKFDKSALKALLWDLALQRTLQELVLVDVINTCRENGEAIPKSETLDNYSITLEGERVLINLLGRREAARVYGVMEGVTSDVKTVDYILVNDSVEHYKTLL
jgi:hypothetical protein